MALRAKRGSREGSDGRKRSRRGLALSWEVRGPGPLAAPNFGGLTLPPPRTGPRASDSGSQLPRSRAQRDSGSVGGPGAQPAGDPRASGLRDAGVPPLPPGTPRPTAAPRLPPAPAAPSARPSPHPAARGGPSVGWPGAPRAACLRRAPGAGMRPSRGLHNGAGPPPERRPGPAGPRRAPPLTCRRYPR